MKHTAEKLELKNGSVGLLIDVPGATVMSFDFQLRAGYFLSERKKWETAHVMEHMLLGANKDFPRARIFQAELQKNGAMSNAFTNTYSISYVAECADFEWQRVLKLMMLAISHPLFLEQEFKSEVGNVRDELVGYLNNHFRELSLRMQEEFGLLAVTDHERLDLIENVTIEDIKDHYKKTHKTDNLRFIIAGNVGKRKSDIKKIVEEELQLGRGERFELPEETPKKPKKAHFTKNTSAHNLHFFIDNFARRRITDEEEDALSLLNTMLTATLHSLMLGEARERGVVYSMGSGTTKALNNTGWWFGAQVMDQNAEELFDIVIDQLTNVLNGKIAKKDIEAAKQYSLGKFQRSAQTVAGLANGYRGNFYYNGTIEDYYDVPNRINAVKKQDMVNIAQAMVDDKVWGLGVLGNPKRALVDKLYRKIQKIM